MNKKLLKQIFMVTFGQMILGVGVGFLLFANLGIDAFGVFHLGVANTFKIFFAQAMFYESLIALIAIFFIDKKYINFATLTSLVLVGYTAGYMENFLNLILVKDLYFIIRLLMVFLGSSILGLGLNLYVLADLGVGALDTIVEMISDKTRFQYRTIKMANDLSFLAIGWYLGGQVGIATVITAFIIGPIIQFIREKISKPFDLWINK